MLSVAQDPTQTSTSVLLPPAGGLDQRGLAAMWATFMSRIGYVKATHVTVGAMAGLQPVKDLTGSWTPTFTQHQVAMWT